jgi:hypothetical protein
MGLYPKTYAHEFRALTGVTPMNYFPSNADDWNHAVLDDADAYNTGSKASAING